MSSLDELIGKAKLLHSEGHGPSQIADELSLDGDHHLASDPAEGY